jgi:hypothetical protein
MPGATASYQALITMLEGKPGSSGADGSAGVTV